jgi:hypothetical protein
VGLDFAVNSEEMVGHCVCSGKGLQWLLGRGVCNDDADLEKGLARVGNLPLHVLGTPSLGYKYDVVEVAGWSTAASATLSATAALDASGTEVADTSRLLQLTNSSGSNSRNWTLERYLDIYVVIIILIGAALC